jgi:hypothetical protein
VNGFSAAYNDGVLYLDSRTSFADIHDGISNTLLIGERPPSADLILGWWYAGWGQNKDGERDMLRSDPEQLHIRSRLPGRPL